MSSATCCWRRTTTSAFTSSAQDSLIVVIHTDGGVSGVGECDANPWMAKACIEAPGTHTMGLCIKDMLIGADPFEIGALWKKMYLGTAMNGRRGMVIHAMSAVDMALWDLCGKALGKPVHALLGGATRQSITPYASLQPAGGRFEEYRDALCASAVKAKALGFKAMKTEITMNGPYAHGGMRESFPRHTEVVAAVREDDRPEHHADGGCAVSLGGRGDLPGDRQGLGRVRHLLSGDADLVRQRRGHGEAGRRARR